MEHGVFCHARDSQDQICMHSISYGDRAREYIRAFSQMTREIKRVTPNVKLILAFELTLGSRKDALENPACFLLPLLEE